MQKLRFIVFVMIIVALIAFAISIFKDKKEQISLDSVSNYLFIDQSNHF